MIDLCEQHEAARLGELLNGASEVFAGTCFDGPFLVVRIQEMDCCLEFLDDFLVWT
jgi:hypothetical protein